MKKILGLDLGTNSIGWALIENDFDAKQGKILGMGSRIIPMSQDVLDKFSGGNPLETQTAARTKYRRTRRLIERRKLRRSRLHRILNILGFLPEHYASQIDFEKHLGQFFDEKDPKIAWKEVWNVKKNKNDFEFVFQSSFKEMVRDFEVNGQERKIPYDWTIYYLRKKALTRKIKKEELAWLILNFNQKRGYYQLRDNEEEKNLNKSIEFHSLKIVNVVADEKPNNKGDIWYSLHLENDGIYRRSSKTPLFDWKDKVCNFIVTTDLNSDGSVKTDKNPSIRMPNEKDDWTLFKKKTENDLEKYIREYEKTHNIDGTVGIYIYETLLKKSTQKIRGKLVHTIERRFYKDELIAILKKQIELQPELFTDSLYNDCIRELYRNNEKRQFFLSKRNFVHLFIDDIIFYQRPLKSQKSSIGNCRWEFRKYCDEQNGKEVKKYLKAVPKSNPLYQEFRLWQFIQNLKIEQKEKLIDDKTAFNVDVTDKFLPDEIKKEELFEWLNDRIKIKQNEILEYYIKPRIKEQFPKLKRKECNEKVKNEIEKYRWNYSEEKEYPCNETRGEILKCLKNSGVSTDFLTKKIEYELWHIIYSVIDKNEFEKALKTFAEKHDLKNIESFVKNFKKVPSLNREYGTYSEKAVKKLLPLMRLGKYWKWENIDVKTQDRINKIISGEYDETIKNHVREKARNLTSRDKYQSLPLWLAEEIVYDCHIAGKWQSVSDLKKYLEGFKQHSLRNPIVEQIIMETLRVVGDIWEKYGDFSEIHIELGREMKNTAKEREKRTNQVAENEKTNLRIKALIMELKESPDVENVRPYSPAQQDILKIYEEYSIQNIEDKDFEEQKLKSKSITKDEIIKINKTAQPSKSELQRYKLWLEQRYCSPYTGKIIPLGKLFTEEYEIEHIIPKARYFDDSLNNKVICEIEVNKLKDKYLGLEFVKNCHGQTVSSFGKMVKIFEEDAYRKFVEKHYSKNPTKKKNLLMEEIPDEMIKRQMNDTRYISKFISQLLSNIVREDKDDDGVNSKNLVFCNGGVTTKLKKDWGLNDVWNNLILSRFERMNKLTGSTAFTTYNEQHQKWLPAIPLELSKGFQKKRIDHRHHCMDALVIACATRDHVNLLNNQSAKSKNLRDNFQNKLRYKEKETWINKKTNERVEQDVFKEFKKPWDTFTENVRNELEKIVVSFKRNLRVVNKTTNKYQKMKDGKKIKVKQEGANWAIRKPLHKEFIFGKVNLSQKVPKEKISVAIRSPLNTTFTAEKIKKITDTGIRKILKNYLEAKDNNLEIAFSPEGIEEMNNNIFAYNEGKFHKPILKVRTYETGSRFPLGTKGNKKDKYVETAKGTNLFFAIYKDENDNRFFETIPLNIVIELLKQGLNPVPKTNEKGHNLLFYLSPNDLVYVPTAEEIENKTPIDFSKIDKTRIYKLTDASDTTANFIPANIAKVLFNMNADKQKKEFGYQKYPIQNEIGVGSQGSKSPNAITGERIKEICIKLKINRLGEVSKYPYD